PSQGRVLLDGTDINESKKTAYLSRFKVGLVFQYPEYQLFEETVEKDIAFGPKNMGLSASEIALRVKESMALVGLDEALKDASPFELSGGQKRRAAIAGVLSMQPRVLVLDEPIAGLDPKGKAEILEVIKKYKEKFNATVIMISHNMDDIAEISDRVIVMHKGRKVLDGTPEAVFSNYEKIIELGLELPTVSALIKALNEKGKNIPKDIVKVNAFIEYVTGVRK
ncbi:MAG: energy-coupling factor transporter ATPase, partial [Clostridia bacterium]|nr:energy-coupling factor transporter ATPase [Clostridia bacterium]